MDQQGDATVTTQQATDDPQALPLPFYVFAIGRIEPRFPSLAVEKEFAQATGRAETAGLTDHQALQSLLSQRQNRYLARQLCWVLSIEGLETYLLYPRDPADVELLVDGQRQLSLPSSDNYFSPAKAW